MRQIFLITILLVFALFVTSCTSDTTPVTDNTEDLPAATSYTIQEVSNHNTEQDCWLVIENKVYDVTDYIPNHPNNKILDGCGKDATQMFSKHPASAKEKLPNYLLGNLN
nr:hypothetical protein [Nanoarchaeum sp.]